jgi:hypothetical protein
VIIIPSRLKQFVKVCLAVARGETSFRNWLIFCLDGVCYDGTQSVLCIQGFLRGAWYCSTQWERLEGTFVSACCETWIISVETITYIYFEAELLFVYCRSFSVVCRSSRLRELNYSNAFFFFFFAASIRHNTIVQSWNPIDTIIPCPPLDAYRLSLHTNSTRTE